MSVLRAFGFEDFTASLSTRPPEKSVGTDEGWAAAEAALEAALKAEGVEYDIDEGGGAFYGPKIDVKVRDATGRSWQLSTIQYDFHMAARLELEYIGADHQRHLPHPAPGAVRLDRERPRRARRALRRSVPRVPGPGGGAGSACASRQPRQPGPP